MVSNGEKLAIKASTMVRILIQPNQVGFDCHMFIKSSILIGPINKGLHKKPIMNLN